MNYYRRFYFLSVSVSLILVLANSTFALSAAQKLDVYFSDLWSDKNINGNVMIADSNQTVYQKSFGMADFENRKANDEKTIFQFDSISKTITAVAVLHLKEKNKLNLDDKFITYFPNFP